MPTEQLKSLVGTLPQESPYTRRIRFHQGWWRAFVLNEPEGRNPANKEQPVCNTITLGDKSTRNFLSLAAIQAVDATKDERLAYAAGMFNEDRLYNNLLSSQPLAFNFFGELKQDLDLATRIFSGFFSGVKVEAVKFEFAPKEKFSGDNSAFDVALEVDLAGKKGLIGIECKYTDSFSPKAYDRPEYEALFKASSNFTEPYQSYVAGTFNQLFRNQLVAEGLVQNKRYDFFRTCLFCFPGDEAAIETGRRFQGMLANGAEGFRIITYTDFIEGAQRQQLTWRQREWTMMLWARYCALRLSASAYGEAPV